MATDRTSPSPASVQCPVCLNDFTPMTINLHLDVCLLENNSCNKPSKISESEPPLKKPRVSLESKSPVPSANGTASGSSYGASSQPSGMFSVFQTDKSKVSPQNGDGALLKGKPFFNKGIKRNLLRESEPAAGPDSQVSGSDIHAVKSQLSPWSLLMKGKPLADILRPDTLEEYFGQNQVIGQQTLFRSLLESEDIPSFILWGPPGCGKVSCRFYTFQLFFEPVCKELMLREFTWLENLENLF